MMTVRELGQNHRPASRRSGAISNDNQLTGVRGGGWNEMLRPLAAMLVLILATASVCLAQSPQKILDEYVRAEGGAKALRRIQSSSIAGSLWEKASDATGSYSLITKAPNRFYSEIAIEPRHLAEAYNGKSAWAQNGSAVPHTLTGRPAAVAEATARYLNGRLADYKKDKIALQFIGIENSGGRQTDRIRLTLAPGVTRDVFFDTQTHLHLIVREIAPSAATSDSSQIRQPPAPSQEFDYDDYRPVSGVQVPYKIELHRDGHIYSISVTQAEINGAVGDSTFNFPRADHRPLPDIPALLLDMSKNQEAIEDLQKQYTCHLTEEDSKTDSKGQVTSRTIDEYDVFYVGGDEVRRLLAKNGVPLTGDAKSKEDRKFSKRFDESQRKQAELANDPKKREKQEQQDQEQISDFLRAESFTNPRRERFRGQDTIVFDFGPNLGYKPRKFAESIAQKLVGVVWVDEQARDVVRLEARFSSNVKIGGGILLSLQKGSNFVFEQTKLNNEVWLPSYAEIHADGRLFFLKVKANEIDRYTDFKKFGVETRIGPPSSPATPAAAPN
ncbi:MAG: hypothetical protein ACRD4S_13410 [Candidatus Acidiferrales bacterium]